jgi:DNA-binding transcriptional ArsR family regulator
MDSFAALADPTRRRIIEMLGHGRLSAGDIAAGFDLSAPAISQHLKALREARLVRVEVQGQRRIYSLDPEGLGAMDEWFQHVRRYWGGRLDALEHELRRPDTTEDKPQDRRSKP